MVRYQIRSEINESDVYPDLPDGPKSPSKRNNNALEDEKP